MTGDTDILDDLFHGCALHALIEEGVKCGGTPDSEATRRRAYQLYEEVLREKNLRPTSRDAA